MCFLYFEYQLVTTLFQFCLLVLVLLYFGIDIGKARNSVEFENRIISTAILVLVFVLFLLLSIDCFIPFFSNLFVLFILASWQHFLVYCQHST